MTKILLKRAYTDPAPEDGYRILVDRLWPRGQTKDKLRLNQWAQQVAPSHELRRAWHHDEQHFEQFAEAYRIELTQNPKFTEFLVEVSRHPVVTFVFAAKNEQINHAAVLQEYLQHHLADLQAE